MNTEKSIDLLNALIGVNNDRIEMYENAAADTREKDLKVLFSQFRNTSQKCNEELMNVLYRLGETPDQEAKTPEDFFNVSMKINATATDDEIEEILQSCACGDDFTINIYKDILKNQLEIISAEQKSIMQAQHLSIKADYEKLKALLDNLFMHSDDNAYETGGKSHESIAIGNKKYGSGQAPANSVGEGGSVKFGNMNQAISHT